MTTPRLGVIFRPTLPPERLLDAAVAADRAGIDELWLWEDCFYEAGISAMTAALAATERLQVGIGVLPVPLRNVALAAMEIATVTRLFPERALIGVGHGVQEWMGQVGASVQSPMTLMREYLTALRGLLDGERVTTHGRYVHLDGVALDWPPAPAPDLHLAAVGVKTLALAGELADGTLLTSDTTRDGVSRARTVVDAARQDAGRTGRNRITAYLPLDTGDPAGADAVLEWMNAGADVVVIEPPETETDMDRFIRFVTDDVRPRL